MKSVYVSLALALCWAPVLANENVKKPQTQVMILASHHMENPGADVINMTADNVLMPKRQREIEAMIEKLKAFNPKKITVEHAFPVAGTVDQLQRDYEKYKAGKAELSKNEVEQVAFRLAKRLGHTRVYGIDAKVAFPYGAVMAFAKENGQSDLLEANFKQGEAMAAKFGKWLSEGSIGEFFYKINRAEIVSGAHDFYMNLLYVGKADAYPGVDLVAGWYRRNLLILANILRVADNEGDRVLVLIGLGHAHLLRQFVTESPTLTLVDPTDFL